MKGRIAVAAGLLAIIGSLQAQAPAGRPFIAVHGEAKMDVVPDIFPVELTLKETSMETAATQARVESLAKNTLAISESLKIGGDDILVSNLGISPEYDWDDETDKQVFRGNTYERTIKVKFRSLPKLNEFISALPKSNVLRIETSRFETSRADELRRGLLESAIANAKKTAEAMASGVGRKLGAVQNISNQGLNIQYSQSLESVTVTAAAAAAAHVMGAPLPPPPPPPPAVLREGKITLDQDVYIVYELN